MSETRIFSTILKALAAIALPVAAEFGMDLIEKMKLWFSGKTVAVIGGTASGKDSLLARLQGKQIPTMHINTGAPEIVEGFTVSYPIGNEKVSFAVNKTKNVGGEEPDRDEYWLSVCEKADVIFYLIAADKWRTNEESAKSRLKNDMRWMAGELVTKPKQKVILIVNKFDVLLENSSPDEFGSVLAKEWPLLKSAVEQAAQVGLGTQAGKLTAVVPLSMSDNYLFSQMFPNVLRAATGQ